MEVSNWGIVSEKIQKRVGRFQNCLMFWALKFLFFHTLSLYWVVARNVRDFKIQLILEVFQMDTDIDIWGFLKNT